jgi:steroid delta-isomerase
MGMTANIKETVERYWAAFSAGDKATWLSLYADDATVEDPVGSAVCRGREEIGAFWDQSRALADSIELRGGVVNVCGDECAFTMEVRPTIGGDVYSMTAIDVMRFDADGRIASMRAFWQVESMRPAED